MQISQPQPLPREEAQRRTLRTAWATLLGFFFLFAAVVGWASLAAWRFYVGATDVHESRLILRGAAEWLTWQPCGYTIFQRTSDQQLLRPCDVVRVANSAGYGQVATIQLFDGSTLDMWAGTELGLVQAETTRWNRRAQEVTLAQSGGYVRYDLRSDQPYESVSYRVRLGEAEVLMAPGGSYSVEVRPAQRRLLVVGPQGPTIQESFVADVAVRSGLATVRGADGEEVALPAGQRLEIDPTGLAGRPIPARWQLVRDGNFNLFSEAEYNNTTRVDQVGLPQADSWQVYGIGAAGVANGYFRITAVCAPPLVTADCTAQRLRSAARLTRAGGQTTGFTTGIAQIFGVNGQGVDISEYRHLRFSAWVRVLGQSLEMTGDQGVECPVMIRMLARRGAPSDEPHERVLCAFLRGDISRPPARWPGLIYQALPDSGWYLISFDLRDQEWFPDYRYLQGIQIYANGHDYDSMVTGVSLIGEQ